MCLNFKLELKTTGPPWPLKLVEEGVTAPSNRLTLLSYGTAVFCLENRKKKDTYILFYYYYFQFKRRVIKIMDVVNILVFFLYRENPENALGL